MKWMFFAPLCAALLFGPTCDAREMESARFPSLAAALKVPTPLTFCDELVPLEVQEVRERLEKELLLSLWDRPQVILWLKRSSRYLPVVEGMLKGAGLPEDIKYAAIAESALRPHAGSHKGAIGFWQFRKATGRRYGLRIDGRIDERRNIYTSTKAAIGYLRELKKTFGTWTLALAAFNMGENGLMTEILEQGTNDYYRLYLSLETQRYVFRILSVKLILSDPASYGFHLLPEDLYPPLEFDRVTFDLSRETAIRAVAEAAKTHFKMIKDLNPEVRGYVLSSGSHTLSVPKGSGPGLQVRLTDLLAAKAADEEEQVYVVKEGDNLSSIAEQFNIPLPAIILWNRLDPGRPIHPGDKLIIQR
jgi:membrane-bound lytic murein transglycosylase D